MRYMMDDDRIHFDVVDMLWQAYSGHIIILSYHSVPMPPSGSEQPVEKQQRRGAIGMLALARRSVVQDWVDVFLKIGLGPMGKACTPDPRDMFLTHYGAFRPT